jgi:DNA-binding NarL/FixJ family response regulator
MLACDELAIVSRYKLFAECLARAIRKTNGFDVVTVEFDKGKLCEYLEGSPSSSVLLISDDIDEEAVAFTSAVARTFEGVKLLIVGTKASEPFLVDYLEAGAKGCLLEEASLSEVGKAIHHVAKGAVICSQNAAPSIFGRLANLCGKSRQRYPVESEKLTLREREILGLMARGLTNAQIANSLSVSAHTVKNHVHNILGKLQVHRRLQAIQQAYGKRWINADSLGP